MKSGGPSRRCLRLKVTDSDLAPATLPAPRRRRVRSHREDVVLDVSGHFGSTNVTFRSPSVTFRTVGVSGSGNVTGRARSPLGREKSLLGMSILGCDALRETAAALPRFERN